MWEKRATSAEGKTIRIAESSDMDSWNELLGLMCKFYKVLSFGKKMNRRMFYATIPRRWYEFAGKMSGPGGGYVQKGWSL